MHIGTHWCDWRDSPQIFSRKSLQASSIIPKKRMQGRLLIHFNIEENMLRSTHICIAHMYIHTVVSPALMELYRSIISLSWLSWFDPMLPCGCTLREPPSGLRFPSPLAKSHDSISLNLEKLLFVIPFFFFCGGNRDVNGEVPKSFKFPESSRFIYLFLKVRERLELKVGMS